MNRRRLNPRLRLQFLALMMLCGMASILGKLWYVQVAHGPEWTKQIRGSSEATVRIPSVRGEIKDRNGVSLVQNRASYEVDFYLPEMVNGYKQRYGRPPVTQYRGLVSGMPKDLKEADIVKIVNDGVVPRLDDLDLARDYNANQLQKHYRTNTEVPYSYIKDIDFATMAKFSEHDVGLPGVDIAIKPVRSYVYGALAAHILGYVGAPDDTNKEEAKKFTFYQGDVDGKSNVEKIADEWLRGQPGVRHLKRNAKGVIEGVSREDPPKQGANVFLTLDARIQSITEEALRAVSRAAAVVIDPNNGNILAMATVPSFDPNTFVPSIKAKDWAALQKDETHPLVNRAISGFPPGSTFKIVTALAGLRRKIGTNKYNCSGGVSYGEHYFRCWISGKGVHGTIGLSDAIKVSCDAFFYQFGNAAGIDAIDQTGNALGLGKETGLHLSGEQGGIMPGPQWMSIRYPQERWSQAYTANVSIGQGYVLATPLQMAMAYATVANGGTSYYPRLIDKVLNQDGTPLLNDKGEPVVSTKPRIDADLRTDFSREQIELVRRGLWKVVNEQGGTGGRAKLTDVEVAGKTGTAEASDRGIKTNCAWFACFAPYDNPKYVIAVMVEGSAGHGGSVAAPIATRILERTLAMDAGKFQPELAWLAPAHHPNPFALIKEVTFKDEQKSVNGDDEEDDTNDSASADVQMAGPGDAPDVDQDPDAGGQVTRKNNNTVRRAQPVAAPQQTRQPSFFERLFGGRRPAPAPTPIPRRQPGRR